MEKITDELYEKIKDILTSRPLDIYSPDNETINESSYELVDSRTYTFNNVKEDSRYIGSSNMFVASSLACYVLYDSTNIADLSDEQLDDFAITWKHLIEKLSSERFLRPINTIVRDKIKVIVDNT